MWEDLAFVIGPSEWKQPAGIYMLISLACMEANFKRKVLVHGHALRSIDFTEYPN